MSIGLWSLKSNALGYGFDIPSLPDTNPLPEKHFTYSLHSNLIEKFFGELIRKTKIDVVKKGLDYIIECAYENGCFPFEKKRNALFTSLYEKERVLVELAAKSIQKYRKKHLHFHTKKFIKKDIFDLTKNAGMNVIDINIYNFLPRNIFNNISLANNYVFAHSLHQIDIGLSFLFPFFSTNYYFIAKKM